MNSSSLGPRRVIGTYTILRFAFIDPETGHQKPVPYGYGFIKLDGADALFQHYIDIEDEKDQGGREGRGGVRGRAQGNDPGYPVFQGDRLTDAIMVNAAERTLVKGDAACAMVLTARQDTQRYGNGDCLLLDFRNRVFALSDGAERYARASRLLLERLSAAVNGAGRLTVRTNGVRSPTAYAAPAIPAQGHVQLRGAFGTGGEEAYGYPRR